VGFIATHIVSLAQHGLRLVAFLLILAAIVDKNRGGPPPPAVGHNGHPKAAVRKVEAR
jgi:hypothetical protein